MKPTTYNLPSDLTDKIGQVAIASERSRSFVVRKLLENALTAADRMAALEAISADGLQAYADAHGPRERLNATEVIASPLEKIAKGNRQ